MSLNTDGVCLDGRESQCGGIIRTINSECLGGFAKHLGNCNVSMAEVWGVYEGFKLAMEMGFSKVDLQVDSSTVVGLIKSDNNLGMNNFSLLNRIWWLLERIGDVKISHTYREANHCANALAKYEGGEDYPEIITHLVHSDVVGSFVPKLILL